MKKYTGKVMALHSRFVKYLETMDKKQLENVEEKIDKYIVENKEFCDKRNHQHLCNIFTSMALYYTLIEQGMNNEKAIEIIFNTMYEYMMIQKIKFKKLSKKRWFFPVIKKIVPLGFKYGSGYGWEYCWHSKKQGKNELVFETKQCIYQKIFSKYGLLEKFGPKFCHNDIIVYGELNHIDFIRTKTLCRGDDECNFKFVKYKNNEEFKRTKSF